jgi:[pyruvate, water dikinase]-phosphate phosphotransferase / [pyruvate, water dikinase] kinase
LAFPAGRRLSRKKTAASGKKHMNESSRSYDRTVFYVSDGTGVTAETFGHSMLSQFERLKIRQIRMPFIDSLDKADSALARINHQAEIDGRRSVVFSTLVATEINQILKRANALFLDLFSSFLEPLEQEFGVRSTHTIGRFHNLATDAGYKRRIEAINFSLTHDDGQSSTDLASAAVILVGVSRSGKTPTSLYLAMQHGVMAANCPLIPEDFERLRLPQVLYSYKAKLFGLTIAPERLHEVRTERRPGSRYASLDNCRYEVAEAEAMMKREGIRSLSSTTKSIEEIATTIMQTLDIE